MLTDTQILIIGLLASVLGQVIKLVFAYFQYELSKVSITVVVSIVSMILAWIFNPLVLPEYTGDLLTYTMGVITMLSTLVGFAMVIYNLLLEKLFEKLSLSKENFKRLGSA